MHNPSFSFCFFLSATCGFVCQCVPAQVEARNKSMFIFIFSHRRSWAICWPSQSIFAAVTICWRGRRWCMSETATTWWHPGWCWPPVSTPRQIQTLSTDITTAGWIWLDDKGFRFRSVISCHYSNSFLHFLHFWLRRGLRCCWTVWRHTIHIGHSLPQKPGPSRSVHFSYVIAQRSVHALLVASVCKPWNVCFFFAQWNHLTPPPPK